MRTARTLALAALVLGAAACVNRVPISGAPCPCPAGYCCSAAGVCEIGSCQGWPDDGGADHTPSPPDISGIAGSTGSADANDITGAGGGAGMSVSGSAGSSPDGGPGLSPDGGAALAPGEHHLSYGDELVMGLTASRRWLATLAAATLSSTGPAGQLMIRDLANGGEGSKSGTIVGGKDVAIGGDVDAVTVSGTLAWTPTWGFRSLRDVLATLSPDGRTILTLGTTSPNSVTLLSTQFAQPHTTLFGRVQGLDLRVDSAPTAFSPNSAFAYVLESSVESDSTTIPARLSRLPTDAAGKVESFEAPYLSDLDNDALGDFAFGGDGSLIFYGTSGAWIWPPKAAQPVELVPNGTGSMAVLGVHDDTAYVLTGGFMMPNMGILSSPKVHRVSLSKGTRELLLEGAHQYFWISPDGSAALAGNWDRQGPPSLIDLATGKTIANVPRSQLCFTDRFKLSFTPDSRFLVGGQCRGVVQGGELWLGDVVSFDVRTGQRRQLATQAIAHDPWLVEGDRVVFVRIKSDEIYHDRFEFPKKVPLGSGDLVVASLETGEVTVLAKGVDEYIAVRGKTVAYTRHHNDATDGVYLLDLP